MARLKPEDIMPVVHDRLRTHYGTVEVISGQGIAKGQRVRFEDGGREVTCVIKTSSGGRISFGRRDDGSWSGLSECDRVVVVAPTEIDGDELMISMFDRQVLVDAFEANLAAQQKAGMAKVPSWLSPFHEEGRGVRGTGDGFDNKALWQEPFAGKAPVPVDVQLAKSPSALAPAIANAAPATGSVRSLTLAEAKEGLARTFGVSPDAIEITIRG